jgi:hypothetical protein
MTFESELNMWYGIGKFLSKVTTFYINVFNGSLYVGIMNHNLLVEWKGNLGILRILAIFNVASKLITHHKV